MKFRRFLEIPMLAFAGLMLIIGGGVSAGRANTPTPKSDAERFVLQQMLKGDEALFETSKDADRTVRASFLVDLLTDPELKSKIRRGVWIDKAVIDGEFLLGGLDITYDLELRDCQFKNAVYFITTHFEKSLNLSGSTFAAAIDLKSATINEALRAALCKFTAVSLEGVKIGGDVDFYGSTFEGNIYTTFTHAKIGGTFSVDACTFNTATVSFEEMKVDGDFSARNCTFKSFMPESGEKAERVRISFKGGHFSDFFLDQSEFRGIAEIDFSRMRADQISLDGLRFITPVTTQVQSMRFRDLSPSDPDRLEFLLAHYDAQLYSDLDASARAHGYTRDANQIFVMRKRAERREGCSGFWSNCSNRGLFLWSLFQDGLAGYGKHLENLLYWSLGFIVIGMLVFWRKDGMRLKDQKAAARAPKYHAFWYSLDLFLPIIKLGETDVWTPNENRRWANLYRRVHIIIGSLFVPIGLAAWTGIIK